MSFNSYSIPRSLNSLKYGSSGRDISEGAPVKFASPYSASAAGSSSRSVVAAAPQSMLGTAVAMPPVMRRVSDSRINSAPSAETPRNVAFISSEKYMFLSLLSPCASAAQIISRWH